MNTPKPHIRPKADACRQRSEPLWRDPLCEPAPYPRDPLREHDAAMRDDPAGRVIFKEDDCLR